MAEIGRLRGRIAAGSMVIADSEVAHVLDVVEAALNEMERDLWAYKGLLAASDGRETILTFDRIGTEGVPVNHAEGTILACTDSDHKWVLISGRWVDA